MLNHLATNPAGLAGGNVAQISTIGVIVDPHLAGYLILHLVKSLTSLRVEDPVASAPSCHRILLPSRIKCAACDCVSSLTVALKRILELYVTKGTDVFSEANLASGENKNQIAHKQTTESATRYWLICHDPIGALSGMIRMAKAACVPMFAEKQHNYHISSFSAGTPSMARHGEPSAPLRRSGRAIST